MNQHRQCDLGEIVNDLASRAESFCNHYFPNGQKAGNYWQIGDVTGAKGRSLTIRLKDFAGKRAGKWTDYATGEFGDLLDLLKHQLCNPSFSELMDEAQTFLGRSSNLSNVTSLVRPHTYRSQRQANAGGRLFSYGKPINGTIGETYLRRRCIARFGSALSYHPSAYLRDKSGNRSEYPALLAAITNNAGDITGCSRIFLNAKSHNLATIDAPKRVMGHLLGNGIRFGAWQTAHDIIVGEGLENILSVGTALPMAALISCLTANHLAAFRWPPHILRIWIAHDNDETGYRGALDLQKRVIASGRQAILLSPQHEDFNLDLCEDGLTMLRHRLAIAITSQVAHHDLWPYEKVA